MYQNLLDTTVTVLTENFILLNEHIRKEERLKTTQASILWS